MKAFDFDAVTYEGEIYCNECLPEGVNIDTEGVEPIFADSEWDSMPTCCDCGTEHDYMIITGYNKLESSGKSDLETEVCEMINDHAEVGYSLESWLQDLLQYGCVSGMVSGLVYYSETVAFYERHSQEIDALLLETCNEFGCSPHDLFKNNDSYDSDDPLFRGDVNKNLLVWFAFEEIARRLASDNGFDL